MKVGSSVVKTVSLGAVALLFLFLGYEAPLDLFTEKALSEIPEENIFSGSYRVEKVVDGDTLVIDINGASQSVRVLGIDAPETEFSSRGAECFGIEASEHAKALLENTSVQLASDSSQDIRDKYDRLLAYVTLPDGRDFGEVMIRNGYSYELTFKDMPYKNQKLYKKAQKIAEEEGLGLWEGGVCGETSDSF